MKMLAKTLAGILFIAFMVSAYSAGTAAAPLEEAFGKYIEVCSQGTVYLPPGTKFVTCHGKVMKVMGVVRLIEGEKSAPGSCYCPDCCGGTCAVIVSCGVGAPATGGIYEQGDLCTAYLACGD